MEGLAASVVLIAIFLGVLLVIAFDVYCLVYLATSDHRPLLKLSWTVLIVCIGPIGGAVYLFSKHLRLTHGSLRLPRVVARGVGGRAEAVKEPAQG